LILLEQIQPVPRRGLIFLCIARLIESTGHLRDAEVVVRILQRARDAPCHCSKADVVKVFHWDIVQSPPTDHPAPALVRPVVRLLFCISPHSGVPSFPVNTVRKSFDVCICEDNVCIRASLGEALDVLTQPKPFSGDTHLCRGTCGSRGATPNVAGCRSMNAPCGLRTMDRRWSGKGSETGRNPKDCLH
jgi:hypothetical protein